MLDQVNMEQLPPGTLIECDELVGLSVGGGMLAVLSSDVFDEGSIVYLKERGKNDWIITRNDEMSPWGSTQGWWVSRDWNGNVRSRRFDPWEDDYDYDDWDCELDEYLGMYDLDRYQDYAY
jgi:hypothetical protein